MKQERIEELLKGTRYEVTPDKDPEWSYDTQHGYACAECSAPWLAKTCSDMVLNAARVQLLAKALREAQELIVTAGKPLGEGHVYLKKPLAEANKVIDAALKEAVLEG